MPETSSDLSFTQYGVLINTINALREELRANQAQMKEMLEDHEQRLRRSELIGVTSFFVIILASLVVFFIVR